MRFRFSKSNQDFKVLLAYFNWFKTLIFSVDWHKGKAGLRSPTKYKHVKHEAYQNSFINAIPQDELISKELWFL